MRSVLKDLRAAIVAIVLITVICGILFPLAMTGIGEAAFHHNVDGQLVRFHGRLVGSTEIGQEFQTQVIKNGKPETSDGEPVLTPDPRYFQTRPSVTEDNAAGSAFSDYGPNSTITLAAIRANITAYIALNGRYVPGGLTAARVPVDAADTSASSVDPDISVSNADLQAYRIAAIRGLSLARVHALIARDTGQRGLGFSGEPGVNVLELNLALDRSTK